MPARTSGEPGLLQRSIGFFFPAAVTTRDQVKAFVAGEASYVTQKAVMGYCRVKTMLLFQELLKDPDFMEGLEICRWETYSLLLGDLIIMAEGFLRPDDPELRRQVADHLAKLYAEILLEHVPPHRKDRGWNDRAEEFAVRFAGARDSEPQEPRKLCVMAARVMQELAPIVDKMKRNDREIIAGDMGFHMVAVHDAMRRRFRTQPVIAALALGRAGG